MLFINDYRILLLIFGYTILNVVVSMSMYTIGYKEKDEVLTRFKKMSPEKLEKTKSAFDQYGTWILFLSLIPVIGAMIVITAGILEENRYIVAGIVFISKFVRNLILAGLLGLIFSSLFAP